MPITYSPCCTPWCIDGIPVVCSRTGLGRTSPRRRASRRIAKTSASGMGLAGGAGRTWESSRLDLSTSSISYLRWRLRSDLVMLLGVCPLATSMSCRTRRLTHVPGPRRRAWIASTIKIFFASDLARHSCELPPRHFQQLLHLYGLYRSSLSHHHVPFVPALPSLPKRAALLGRTRTKARRKPRLWVPDRCKHRCA
jgi:hypothetical protein